ncbi:MAG: hypothetical protein ACNA7J_06835 [Wenzhouxiangella sp.]
MRTTLPVLSLQREPMPHHGDFRLFGQFIVGAERREYVAAPTRIFHD